MAYEALTSEKGIALILQAGPPFLRDESKAEINIAKVTRELRAITGGKMKTDREKEEGKPAESQEEESFD